jgi:hypothetical protein
LASKYLLVKNLLGQSEHTDNQNKKCLYNKQNKTKQTMSYDIVNSDPGLGQTQQCGRVKPVNGMPNLPS